MIQRTNTGIGSETIPRKQPSDALYEAMPGWKPKRANKAD